MGGAWGLGSAVARSAPSVGRRQPCASDVSPRRSVGRACAATFPPRAPPPAAAVTEFRRRTGRPVCVCVYVDVGRPDLAQRCVLHGALLTCFVSSNGRLMTVISHRQAEKFPMPNAQSIPRPLVVVVVVVVSGRR